MNTKRLSDREFDVMQILWKSEKPLLASEIIKADAELNINTVQATLRKLLTRDFVRVADIVQSGKVLGRTYAPILSADEYILSECQEILPSSSHRNTFFSAFLEKSDNKEEALHELEELIRQYREK